MRRSCYRAAAGSLPALLIVLAGLSFAASASAAPTLGPAGSAFYTPPSPLPSGSPGTLISYRPATLGLGSGAPSVTAWDILYRTSDALGNAGRRHRHRDHPDRPVDRLGDPAGHRLRRRHPGPRAVLRTVGATRGGDRV